MNDLIGVHVDSEEGEERSKPDVMDLQKVARPDGVVGEERLPGLSIPWRSRGQDVALDGALGDPDAELEQFSANPLRVLGAVVTGHTLDQFDSSTRVTPALFE